VTAKSLLVGLRRPRPAAEARLTLLRKAGRPARAGCGPRTLRSPTRWPTRKVG
jgi:hypothetical protein